MFTNDPGDEASICRAWRIKARKQLRDIFYDIHKKDASTHWLIDEILQALKAYLDPPGFKTKQMNALLPLRARD